MIPFLHYMFLPHGQPWYTGAFWSNQTQWTLVWIPSLIFTYWRGVKRGNKHHEALKAHISAEHAASREHLENHLANRKRK